MEEFRGNVDLCGLSNLGFQGNKFTWCNNKEWPHLTKERLDHALRNLEWTKIFSDCYIQALATHPYDHNPMVMHLRNEGRRSFNARVERERIFRYEASWKQHDECCKIIANCWSQ